MATHLQEVMECVDRSFKPGGTMHFDRSFDLGLAKSTAKVFQLAAPNAISFDAGDLKSICDFKVIDELQRMPYPCMWIEGDWIGNGFNYRAGMLIIDQNDGTITGQGFAKIQRSWCLTWVIDKLQLIGGNGHTISGDQEFIDNLYDNLDAFRSFLSAINCTNVRRVEHKPDDKLQKARTKRGKQPLFSYWTLELDLSRPESSESLGGTHASPRLHLRRGHPRQYAPGKYTWVQPCVVGNKAAGMVHKDYRLAARDDGRA